MARWVQAAGSAPSKPSQCFSKAGASDRCDVGSFLVLCLLQPQTLIKHLYRAVCRWHLGETRKEGGTEHEDDTKHEDYEGQRKGGRSRAEATVSSCESSKLG